MERAIEVGAAGRSDRVDHAAVPPAREPGDVAGSEPGAVAGSDAAVGESLDLRAYLERIGYSGPLRPTLEVLRGLHLAHATGIPFENLDILLGRPIRLDLGSLQAKLVHGRRGGYCFEHNSLFAAVLEAVGFDVTRLAARVRMGRADVLPRTHMLLGVELDGSPWIADVGFGGEGLLWPVPMDPGPEVHQFGRAYRVTGESGGIRVLQLEHSDGWLDLYAFTLEPQHDVDYVMANHYTSTYPESAFVQNLVAQRVSTDSSWTLRNRELTETRGDVRATRLIEQDEELLRVLAECFGLEFPAGTRFGFGFSPGTRFGP